ncbi:MAG: peroxiredoxin [Bacteroidetes bacterium QS_7_67_15]|nr:MAG: peroxiredoxin [Bacteroidetes bacterium QS_7_67_15]
MPVRTADATWNGNLSDGDGMMKTESGAYEGDFSFASRFEDTDGTNPEELIASAHAGCFSMALSNILADAGHTPERVHTTAKVHLEMVDDAPTITHIDLDTEGDVPELDEQAFQEHAETAKANCPVSKLVQGAEISVSARLA